ncbi:MAG TPA: tetratricopeptide repeat protein [Vicinamibacterales bacterium]|nr:tetratricopeptide repeat protein [Vicinamibacterales bacterium]
MRAILAFAAIVFVCSLGGASAQPGPPAPDAWEALRRGDASKAAALFRAALERDPYNAVLYYGAGLAAVTLGRTNDALAAFRRALEQEPRFTEAALALGQLAYQSGDLDLAIKSFERAQNLAPHDARIREQLERWRSEALTHSQKTERHETHFRILFEGSEQRRIGERVARVLESAYWRVGEALQAYPPATLDVVLYTEQQFQDITRAPAWAGGAFDGRIRIAVKGALRTPAALDRLVTHEFVHAAIATIAPRHVPTWVNEGLACLLETPDRRWRARALRSAPTLIPLGQLEAGFSDLDGGSALLAYAESALAAEVLSERVGANLGAFLQMLDSGHTIDQTLGNFGILPEEFYAEWYRRASAPAARAR